MRNRIHGNWESVRKGVTPPLLRELMRVFNASDVAVLCGLSHGQVTIDGYVIREQHLTRWTPDRLYGRMARFAGRAGRLYGGSQVIREAA